MHGPEQVTADAVALSKGLCPECGADLTKLNPELHAIQHWGYPGPDAQLYPDAARRYKMVHDFHGPTAAQPAAA